MGKNRARKNWKIQNQKVKRFKRFDQQVKGMLNTGHTTPPCPTDALLSRDAMSTLWEGEFSKAIEAFSRKLMLDGRNVRLWLIHRQSTYIYMRERFDTKRRYFSIFYGSELRAYQSIGNICWYKDIPMDNTRIENDRTVQSPQLWKVPRHKSSQQQPHD
jgi:hypothetical protein